MRNWRVVLLVTAGWIAYAIVTAILSLPFGMAEPGQPQGLEGFGLLWAFGEWCRTWWVFVRRGSTVEVASGQRRDALLIVFTASTIGALCGLGFFNRSAYELSEISSAAITTAGCWIGRYLLRRHPTRPA